MIRAGRTTYTLAQLAQKKGLSKGRFSNLKIHKAREHPAPVSSERARLTLWDAGQIDAHYAGEPVPPLPPEGPGDLLDRHEVAAVLGVDVGTWDRYVSGLPGIPGTPDPLDVHGVEHWRRGDITDWDAQRPGYGSGGGRPRARHQDAPTLRDLSGADLLPPGHPEAAALLDTPELTAEAAAERLDLTPDSARRALRAARARALAEALPDPAGIDPAGIEQTARDELGYTARDARTAARTVAAWHRAAAAHPYLLGIQTGLEAEGLTVSSAWLRVRPGDIVTASLAVTDGPTAGYLIWDERYGWRTSPTAVDATASETAPPTGPGIRYLCRSAPHPDAAHLRRQVADRRTGTRQPKRIVAPPGALPAPPVDGPGQRPADDYRQLAADALDRIEDIRAKGREPSLEDLSTVKGILDAAHAAGISRDQINAARRGRQRP
ncbi:hypothetical protein GCM10009801_73280 [Streptomyces albiaxialis]|uniref:Uncharacterized protein n=1 Tax=Streptomyces albiaxialis TaxID=329523 RepID=A0ABN2WX05_9ACTN